MTEPILNPREVFDKIDSISMCKVGFVEWCREAEIEAVETLLTMTEKKHTALANEAKNLEKNNKSDEDIESILYELMYFMHMYQTANRTLDLRRSLN